MDSAGEFAAFWLEALAPDGVDEVMPWRQDCITSISNLDKDNCLLGSRRTPVTLVSVAATRVSNAPANSPARFGSKRSHQMASMK
jgi:hypothetical protein